MNSEYTGSFSMLNLYLEYERSVYEHYENKWEGFRGNSRSNLIHRLEFYRKKKQLGTITLAYTHWVSMV